MPEHWNKMSTKKTVSISKKEINSENPGLKYTPAKFQPIWLKTRRMDKDVGKHLHP